jgi:hypothetical protein
MTSTPLTGFLTLEEKTLASTSTLEENHSLALTLGDIEWP